jgi:hypothetical protein
MGAEFSSGASGGRSLLNKRSSDFQGMMFQPAINCWMRECCCAAMDGGEFIWLALSH